MKGLRDYERKRDFSKTKEPPSREHAPERSGSSFVIQKHAARRLHYDFRLEMEGVLKSWAVPKGIPFREGERHLAVHVEDHPLDYARFEGTIPEHSYGAGTVMVWDFGGFVCSGNPAAALKAGKLHLRLSGQKLRGEWTLVRTRIEGDKEDWLLMKTGGSVRPVGRKRDDTSALTGRSMRQIAAATEGNAPHAAPGSRQKAKAAATPRYIRPMHAKLVEHPPEGAGWSYELKLDGYRAVAVKDGSKVELFSRNELPFHFPTLAQAVAALPCGSAVLDGEVVALDAEGRPSFALLHARESGELGAAENVPLYYYLFDLLLLDGDDLCSQPLRERKRRLEALLANAEGVLRFSSDLPGKPGRMLEMVKARGLEGIVAKRSDSTYESGRRSGAWVKIKCANEQEFVIGGYTPPKGARSYFGALLVGYFDRGRFHFAGKVGTGFSERRLGELVHDFQALKTEECPFAPGELSELSGPERKGCTWLRPERVCQIRFSQWTRDGRLRQPVFLGLRDDKAASEVVKEA